MITPFDKLFDFNNDGKVDGFERTARDGFFLQMSREMAKNDRLFDAGIDPDEFALMDNDEQAAALAEAGIDFEDF